MVKLIFCPKFEQQCARRMADDPVCRRMLPMPPLNGSVTVAICQDGRWPWHQSDLAHESDHFRNLYHNPHCLNRPDIRVHCYGVSFVDPPHIVQGHIQAMATTDIFFMTGFSPGATGLSRQLQAVFDNHARMGEGQLDTSSMMENLYRCIVARCQYNQMVYMGTCGGAMVAGRWFWDRGRMAFDRRMRLFDLCMGVSIRYDSGLNGSLCNAHAVIDPNTFYMTSGAAGAVHIENDVVAASSFPCGKNNAWKTWADDATPLLQNAVRTISQHNVSGPWIFTGYPVWYLSVNGTAFYG